MALPLLAEFPVNVQLVMMTTPPLRTVRPPPNAPAFAAIVLSDRLSRALLPTIRMPAASTALLPVIELFSIVATF